MKRHRSLDHFFQGKPRRFVFGGIDFDAGPRAALELLAALRRQDDQTILGINLL